MIQLTSQERVTFRNMIGQTRACMAGTDGSFEEYLKCETAYLSDGDRFTYHTHPCGTPEPSEADRRTTSRLNKQWLLIGLVPSNEIVGYEASDGFRRMRFRQQL